MANHAGHLINRFETNFSTMRGELCAVPDVLNAIDRLQALADASPDAQLGAWLSEALALVRVGVPLADAVGLDHGFAIRRRTQSEALTLLAAAAQPGSRKGTAVWIAQQIRQYERRDWLADRDRRIRPDGMRGCLYDYMRAGGPTSGERIRKLLPRLVKKPLDLTSGSAG